MPPAELNPFMLTSPAIYSEEQALNDTTGNLINQEVTTFGDEMIP